MLNAFIYLSVAVLICFGICFFVFQRKERDWERISVLSLSLSLILVLVLRCYAEFRCGCWTGSGPPAMICCRMSLSMNTSTTANSMF